MGLNDKIYLFSLTLISNTMRSLIGKNKINLRVDPDLELRGREDTCCFCSPYGIFNRKKGVLNMSLWLGQLGNHASRMTINLID